MHTHTHAPGQYWYEGFLLTDDTLYQWSPQHQIHQQTTRWRHYHVHHTASNRMVHSKPETTCVERSYGNTDRTMCIVYCTIPGSDLSAIAVTIAWMMYSTGHAGSRAVRSAVKVSRAMSVAVLALQQWWSPSLPVLAFMRVWLASEPHPLSLILK